MNHDRSNHARVFAGTQLFTTPGLIVFLIVLGFAVIGVVLLATGMVQI